MTYLSVTLQRLEENRGQTRRFIAYLELLARHEARERGTRPEDEGARLLAAEPERGDGEPLGSIGWHLLHVAVFEEGCLCAPPRPELWRRFGHGESPFAPGLPLTEIERELADGRARLLDLAGRCHDGMLDTLPPDLEAGGMTYRDLLEAAAWHEPHHLVLCNENLQNQFMEISRPERR